MQDSGLITLVFNTQIAQLKAQCAQADLECASLLISGHTEPIVHKVSLAKVEGLNAMVRHLEELRDELINLHCNTSVSG